MQGELEGNQGRADTIARLNDRLRQHGEGGQIVVTQGVKAKGDEFIRDVLSALKSYADFPSDNDPYGERDFGAMTVNGQKVLWKIDYHFVSASCCDTLRPMALIRMFAERITHAHRFEYCVAAASAEGGRLG